MVTDADKYDTTRLLKRIFGSYMAKHKKRIFLAILFMLVVAATSGFHVWLVKPAMDGIFMNKQASLLWLVPIAVVTTICIKGIADYYQSYIIKSIGQNVVNDIQLDLYKNLLFSDIRFLNQHSSGNLISKFTNDIISLKNSISLVIVNFFREFLTLIFLLVIMFYNEPMLSMVSFFVFPIAILPIVTMGKRMKKVAHHTQDELCNYTVKLDENFRNIKIIKSFCTEKLEVIAAHKVLNKLLNFYNKAIRIESLSSPIMEMLGGTAIAAVIWYGGKEVLLGNSSPGGFFSFIVAFLTAYRPVKNLANLNVTLQNGLASAKRIFIMIDMKHKVEEQRHKQALSIQEPSIEFDNVFYKYDDKKDALKGVTINIKPLSLVALIGESGSGKSTMLDLLLKFDEPYKGSISIDGQNLAGVSPESVRRNISIVNQDIMLFDSTIEENIRYGSSKHSKKELREAVAAAAADEFIGSLPEKYDTRVGQFGIQLSGGQKQRIAIARAIYKDSKIMVFDEATSSLDQSSEQIITEAIEKLKHKKTIILVTHRLSSIQNADCIYVLKDGRIVEHGTHKELLDNHGEYYRLHNKNRNKIKRG